MTTNNDMKHVVWLFEAWCELASVGPIKPSLHIPKVEFHKSPDAEGREG